MTRVAYIECSGEIWHKIAAHAQAHHGWQPIYWSCAKADIPQVARSFPGSVTHNGVAAAKGVLPTTAQPIAEPALDAALLDALAPHESMALHMMDRMDAGGAFSHEERRRHYYDLLRMWLGLYNALRPEIVVFSIAPHAVYDYVAYALARHLSIPTVMFERLGLPGYVYPVREIEGDVFAATAHDRRTPGPAFQKYFDDNRAGGSAAVPVNFQRKLDRFRVGARGQIPAWQTIFQETRRAAYLFRRHGFGPIEKSYQKLKGVAPAASQATAIDAIKARIAASHRKRKLRAHLDRLATAPADGQRYVLLALHYQPERATVPMGGALADQTLMVDLLAKALPDGVMLYVKEHPWQLQSASRPEVQRSHDFYDRLVQHPNVRLIGPDVSTADLIDGALAVATSTGSVGWQAICRGIPALVFGAAWYKRAPGAHIVRSALDARTAIDVIRNGARPDPADVLDHLAQVEAACVRGVLEPDIENVEGLDYDEAAPAMSDALERLVSSR